MVASEIGLVLPAVLALGLAASIALNVSYTWAIRRARKDLAAEKNRTELVIRATQTGIFDWDVTTNRIDYSERFKEILGFPLNADLSDRTRHFDNVHPEDREQARAAFVTHLREGRDNRNESLHPPIEYRLKRADGGYNWVRGTGLSLRGADGRTTRYIASIIDISERRRHEIEAANNGKFIQDLIESVPMSISYRDMEGRYRLVNRTWEHYFRSKREQVIGKTLHELMPAQLADPIEAEHRAALERGPGAAAEQFELQLRGRRYQQTRTAMADAAGNTIGLLLSARDITDQHEVQQALETQRQRLELVVRASKVGIIDWDGVTRAGWYSDRLRDMLGYAADADLSSWNFFDAVHPEDAPALRATLVATLKGRSGSDSLESEYRMQRADGSYLWLRGTGLAQRGADGRATRFLTSIADISARRAQEEALREQMDLTRDLIRALPNPLFLKDEQFRFVHVNPAWEKVAAVPAEKAIGKVIPEVYPPEYADEFLAQDRALLAEPTGANSIEVSIPGRHGPRQYILNKSLLRREDGSLRGMVGSMTDITRHKRIESQLRDQVTLTREIIDSNPNPIFIKDAECRFIEVNPAWSQFTGIAAADAIGKTAREIYPGELAGSYDAQDRELMTRGEGVSAKEVKVRRADGAQVEMILTKSVLKDSLGRIRGLVGSATDVGELKIAEQRVRENEERMRFWLENIPIAIAIYDPEGGVQFLNSAFVATFGWTLEEMRGKRMPFVPENRREQLAGVLHNLLTVGKDAFETERLTRDGRMLDVYISTGMARAPDGSTRATMVSLMDVTERKRMERELAASREEALQAAQAKAAFLAAMSHEIRTPLNGVLGMAGLLAETGLTEEQREYVDTVRISGDALLSVINDILDYSKIESGRMDFENEPFEPMRAIEEALEILGESARGKRLELAAEAEDAVPAWVSGDFARVRQVLVNLVGNAVKFTERGEVVVRLRAPRAGTLEIEVSDTGIGIPKDRLAGLFQAFTQADVSTTRKYGGTGLGLAISKRLVELMGGDLRAVSEPGRGSTFVFSVSVGACDAPAAAASAAQPVELTGRRILIVDDNATNLRILRRQLERWGAVPVAASGGPAALSLLDDKERFDAALLDYHMPEMDGVMLARRIKKKVNSLPLLLLSSSMYRRADEAEAGLFVVQLLKPVRQQQLREALVTALGGAAPSRKGRGSRVVAGVPAQTQLRVLVVDDVDANCRLARALLRKFGHVSEVAVSGLEAVRMATADRYDVILMDVQMPDIDGMEATRRIHEQLGAASPRIIAVTAGAMPGDRERCVAAGMDDYLSKPIQHQALRAAIEQVGGTARFAAPPAVPSPRAASSQADAIDWGRIESLKPFDPDGSMVSGAIASFFADAPERIKAIREAHAAGDAAGTVSAAHALKGSAANIGAARLQELSQAIESLAREGRLEGAVKPVGGLAKALAAARAAFAAKKGRTSP